MRLWHYSLIPYLPRQQLVAQWRECCAIVKNWATKGTPNHILVNKVMDYPSNELGAYTEIVLLEIKTRGYRTTSAARNNFYYNLKLIKNEGMDRNPTLFFGWHNDIYLRECLYNLEEKAMCGGMTKDEWDKIYNKFKDFTPLWRGEG